MSTVLDIEKDESELLAIAQEHHIDFGVRELEIKGSKKGGCTIASIIQGCSYLSDLSEEVLVNYWQELSSIDIRDTPLYSYMIENSLPAVLEINNDGVAFCPEWLEKPHSEVLLSWINPLIQERFSCRFEILEPTKNGLDFKKRIEEVQNPIEIIIEIHTTGGKTFYHSLIASPLRNSKKRVIHDSNFLNPIAVAFNDIPDLVNRLHDYKESDGSTFRIKINTPQIVIKKVDK